MRDVEIGKRGECPSCGGRVIKDFNAMPQSAWETDAQTWHCEECGTQVRRHFTGSLWTGWEVV